MGIVANGDKPVKPRVRPKAATLGQEPIITPSLTATNIRTMRSLPFREQISELEKPRVAASPYPRLYKSVAVGDMNNYHSQSKDTHLLQPAV